MSDLITQTDISAIGIINSSEINMQIATAKKYRRDIQASVNEATALATLTVEVAEECHYALPRKENGTNKMIEGASVRFAEIIFNSWGNCRAGARVVAEERDHIIAQGVYQDLEKNTAITFEVKRKITNKSGQRYNADMITTTGNAAASIALRNAILKGIPKAFWSGIYAQTRKVAMGDAKTLTNRRSESLAYFKKLGVEESEIFTVLGVRNLQEIGLEELLQLKGIATAIKEGDISIENAFRSKDTNEKKESIVKQFATSEAIAPQKANFVHQSKPEPIHAEPIQYTELMQQIIDKLSTFASRTGELIDDLVDELTKKKVSSIASLAQKPEPFQRAVLATIIEHEDNSNVKES